MNDGSFARAFAVLAALGAGTATTARAQPLPHVELSWQGPTDCQSAEDVLTRAAAQLGPIEEPSAPVHVVVLVAARDDGLLVLEWSARGETLSARRTMTLASCAEVREAAALLIAMALSPHAAAAAAPPDPEPDPSSTTPAPAPPPAPAAAPAPEPARASAPAPAPARDLSGWWLGPAVGLDLQMLPGVMIVLGARAGIRWGASSLELDAFYGLPATRSGAGEPELTTDMLAIAALGCQGAALRPLQLELCAGPELARADVQLQGADAGAKIWLRLVLEPRLSLLVTTDLAVGLHARVLISPDPADFSNAARDHARAPVLGLLPLLGVTWHPR